MIITSTAAILAISNGDATFEGVTESAYAILTNHVHHRVDHVEIENHVIGKDFKAAVLETGIVFSNNSAATEVYSDFESMVERVGESHREELEQLF